MSMNPIQLLQEFLIAKFPDAEVVMDEPLLDSGMWSLDVEQSKHWIIVDWTVKKPSMFGITCPEDDRVLFGQLGSDEYCDGVDATLERVSNLLTSKTFTKDPHP